MGLLQRTWMQRTVRLFCVIHLGEHPLRRHAALPTYITVDNNLRALSSDLGVLRWNKCILWFAYITGKLFSLSGYGSVLGVFFLSGFISRLGVSLWVDLDPSCGFWVYIDPFWGFSLWVDIYPFWVFSLWMDIDPFWEFHCWLVEIAFDCCEIPLGVDWTANNESWSSSD